MWRLFWSSQRRLFGLWLQCWRSGVRPERNGWHRVGLVLIWPVVCLFQWLHWIGFVLDALFFRGDRRVEIVEPLFVVGPPRSGTTHLHHVLARDRRYTTFRTWECLFGLSVTARKLIMVLARVDRQVGRPGRRGLEWLERRLWASLDEVHPFSLEAPEEDFLCFLPLGWCFILIVLFPNDGALWRMAMLDLQPDESERADWLRWYRRCIQKHLYVHGAGRRFLSKNPSFSGSVATLIEAFPDARFIACSRNPEHLVASQLSALLPGLRAAGFPTMPEALQLRLLELLRMYFEHLDSVARAHPGRMALIDNSALRHRLRPAVEQAFEQIDRPLDDELRQALEDIGREAGRTRSAHRYHLRDFDLSPADIHDLFSEVYRRWRFDASGAVLR
jgi:hypothetical protein